MLSKTILLRTRRNQRTAGSVAYKLRSTLLWRFLSVALSLGLLFLLNTWQATLIMSSNWNLLAHTTPIKAMSVIAIELTFWILLVATTWQILDTVIKQIFLSRKAK